MSIKSLFLAGFLLVSQTTFCDTASDQAQFEECLSLILHRKTDNVIVNYINGMSPAALNAWGLPGTFSGKSVYGDITVLHLAVCYKRVTVIKALLSKMSLDAINAKIKCGGLSLTALDCAIKQGSKDIADMIRVAIHQK